jgi:hypothetical protein
VKSDAAELLVIAACAGFFVLSAGVFAWQTYVWLRFGVSSSVLVIDAWRWAGFGAPPITDWIGLNRVIASFMETSLSAASFGASILTAFLVLPFVGRH